MSINTTDVTHQGQVITQYRKAKKWSQEDLAEALRVDVRTVQRMEKQAMIKNISRRPATHWTSWHPCRSHGIRE